MKKKENKKNNDNRRSKQTLSLSVQDVSVYKILYHRLKEICLVSDRKYQLECGLIMPNKKSAQEG